MSDSYQIIKKLIKKTGDNQDILYDFNIIQSDINAHLNRLGLDRDLVIKVANNVGKDVQVTSENSENLEHFADFLVAAMNAHAYAIHIYLEIIKLTPHISAIYRKLLDIYFYDITAINKFEFISNAQFKFSNPIEALDPLYCCMSYTYIGKLFQRLGRFADARKAFNMAIQYRHDKINYSETAEYGNLELDFLARIHSIEPIKSNNKPLLIIGTVFFGSKYEQLFRQAAGATFLCKENLETIQEKWQPVLIVFCTFFDKLNFEYSDFFKNISKCITIKIFDIPECLISQHPDHSASKTNINAVLANSLSVLLQTGLLIISRRSNASLINLPPDAIYSNTLVSTIKAALQEGYKIIFTPGIRLEREKVLNAISATTVHNSLYNLGLSSTQISNIALENLHPATKACFVTNKKMTYPGLLLWPIEEKGLVMHGFQMHPIFINSDIIQKAPIRLFDSIDGDFVQAILPNRSDWDENVYVVTESKKAMMFELSDEDVKFDNIFDTEDLLKTSGSWVAACMRPINFWLLNKRVYIGDFNEIDINNSYQQADKIISHFVTLGKSLPIKTFENSDATIQQTYLNLEKIALSLDSKNDCTTEAKSTPCLIGQEQESIKVLYSLAVWGFTYIENFLNICLPSMLAEGNLKELSNNKNSLFLLYTEDKNLQVFEKSSQFQKLKKIIDIEIININPENFNNKYSTLSHAQSDSVQRSRNFDAICFLYSDFLWAKNSLKFALQKISEGYDGVVSPVPPVVFEDFYTTIQNNQSDFIVSNEEADSFNISIDQRTLIKYAKEVLHPMMKYNILDYKLNTGSPAYVLWLGPGGDLLIRCFHTHPVMLKVKHNTPDYWIPFDKTLDEGFLPRAFASTDKLYFVRDSDEIAIISLTERDFATAFINDDHHLDAAFIANWAEAWAAPMHKMAFNYFTIWHEHEINQDTWRPVIERSEIVAQEIRMRLLTPDSVLRSENIDAYQARKGREYRLRQPQANLQLSITEDRHASVRHRLLMVLIIVIKKVPVSIKEPILSILKRFVDLKPELWNKLIVAYQNKKAILN